MNIAVVDDNLNDRKMILDYLSQFFNESGLDYTTSTFEDGVSF